MGLVLSTCGWATPATLTRISIEGVGSRPLCCRSPSALITFMQIVGIFSCAHTGKPGHSRAPAHSTTHADAYAHRTRALPHSITPDTTTCVGGGAIGARQGLPGFQAYSRASKFKAACVTPFWVSLLGNKLIPPPIDIHLTDAGTNTMALHEGLITGRGRGGLRENERTPDRERARESGCVCVREREREREREKETDRQTENKTTCVQTHSFICREEERPQARSARPAATPDENVTPFT